MCRNLYGTISLLVNLMFLPKRKIAFTDPWVFQYIIWEVEYQISVKVEVSTKLPTPLLPSQDSWRKLLRSPPPTKCATLQSEETVKQVSCLSWFCPMWITALSQFTQGCVRMLPPRTCSNSFVYLIHWNWNRRWFHWWVPRSWFSSLAGRKKIL